MRACSFRFRRRSQDRADPFPPMRCHGSRDSLTKQWSSKKSCEKAETGRLRIERATLRPVALANHSLKDTMGFAEGYYIRDAPVLLIALGSASMRSAPRAFAQLQAFYGRFNARMNSSVILITGALSGIGKAAALAFARTGCRLAIAGRRDDVGQALADELRALGADAEFFRVDVRSDDDLRDLVDRTVARFGRLDVAVNSAGTEGKPGPVTEQTAESYAAAFDTNVLGTLLSMKHELRVMQPQGSGSIVNLSSTTGHRGSPGASVYTASKHAVEGLTKAAALEAAAFGVRVNAVAPGPVDTDLLTRFAGSDDRRAALVARVPFKRAGKVEEIADAITFLASDQAAFITGQIIDVNGGITAS